MANQTVTNKASDTATVTNKTFSASGLLVGDADMLVSDAQGTVATPYGITNKVVHIGSVTNKTQS